MGGFVCMIGISLISLGSCRNKLVRGFIVMENVRYHGKEGPLGIDCSNIVMCDI